MTTYATDRRFSSSGAVIGIRLATDGPMSFTDYAEVLKDIDSIYSACSKELTARQKSSNKKKDGMLVVESFRSGSLEIFADPYFSGVVTGTAANAVTALFVYVMRRIHGRARAEEKVPLNQVDKAVISDENLSVAANHAVQSTAKNRKNLHDKHRSFGLAITISWGQQSYEVTEPGN